MVIVTPHYRRDGHDESCELVARVFKPEMGALGYTNVGMGMDDALAEGGSPYPFPADADEQKARAEATEIATLFGCDDYHRKWVAIMRERSRAIAEVTQAFKGAADRIRAAGLVGDKPAENDQG